MAFNKKLIFSVICLSFLLISMNTVLAKNVILKVCTDKDGDCYDYNDGDFHIGPEEALILKVEIINEENKFMCWEGMQYTFYYRSNNIGDSNKGEKYVNKGVRSNSDGTPFCFSNSNKIANEFYIPLADYNELKPSERMGSWEISDFNLIFEGLIYYPDASLKNSKSVGGMWGEGDNYFKGNVIKFTVVDNLPKKGWFGGIKNGTFRGILIGLNALLVIIAGGLWLKAFDVSKKKRGKYIGWAILFTFLSIILFGTGFS